MIPTDYQAPTLVESHPGEFTQTIWLSGKSMCALWCLGSFRVCTHRCHLVGNHQVFCLMGTVMKLVVKGHQREQTTGTVKHIAANFPRETWFIFH